jgi:hypothetical protein
MATVQVGGIVLGYGDACTDDRDDQYQRAVLI